MISFVGVTVGYWDKDGASLPVIKWKVMRDGQAVGEVESWCDLKENDADSAVLTIGISSSMAIELDTEALREIGFRPGMHKGRHE